MLLIRNYYSWRIVKFGGIIIASVTLSDKSEYQPSDAGRTEYQSPAIGRISIIKKHVDHAPSETSSKLSYSVPKVMVAIPCYNEEVAIGSIVIRARCMRTTWWSSTTARRTRLPR